MGNQMLYERLDFLAEEELGEDYFKEVCEEHQDILDSLNPKFKIREYQQEAIGRCIYYSKEYRKRKYPHHLLFNMATGSGKTLIMAALMLYLYKQGYRNFVFFTHLSNIVEKTKDNFLNPNSSKYLFSSEISIDGDNIPIIEVDSFDASSDKSINIIFTTMGGLHNSWQNPRENGLSAEALASKKVVLLGDEAHHFSAKTKELGTAGESLNKSWEHTILAKQGDSLGDLNPGLLYINSDEENILLEFTATLDCSVEQIKEKYHDKIIFRYDLAQFRRDGYSKNVKTLESKEGYFKRCLVAIVLSQYRLKVSEGFSLKPRSIKPVILFKSNRVQDPKDMGKTEGEYPELVVSNRFKEMFHERIEKLSAGDLDEIKDSEENVGILKMAFDFFQEKSIDMESLAREIKRDFAPEYCLSVDNEKEVEKRQLLLNSLEDQDNSIRAIFATEKLNEGWDVLNLFDIVRLYGSHSATKNKLSKSTVQEAQLIGRGARYCPFKLNDADDLYKRKFDDSPDEHLAALEVLHYHCTHNPKYISDLNTALITDGIKDEETGDEYVIEPKKNIPDIDIKRKVSWKKVNVFLNERISRPKVLIKKAVADAVEEWGEEDFYFDLGTKGMRELSMNTSLDKKALVSIDSSKKTRKITKKASDLGENVLRHAIGAYPKAHLDNLMKYCSGINSISDLIQIIMDNVDELTIKTDQNGAMSQDDKLFVAKKIVGRLLENMLKRKTDYVGSKEYTGKQLGIIFGDPKKITVSKEEREEYTGYKTESIQDLVSQPWFAQTSFDNATDQEVAFLEFIDSRYGDIKKLYDYFLVFRNDNHFSIYNTENKKKRKEGEAFNPDFLLVLREKETQRIITHQVFVEAKGPQFLDGDRTFEKGNQGWKEEFLLRILGEAKIDVSNRDIAVMGLPFFHKKIKENGEGKRYKAFKDFFKNSILKDPTNS